MYILAIRVFIKVSLCNFAFPSPYLIGSGEDAQKDFLIYVNQLSFERILKDFSLMI